MPKRSRNGADSIPARVVAPTSVKRLQRQLQRLRVRAAIDDEVDLEIFHRRIEKLFDDAPEPVNLVDEQDVAVFERGEDADEILRLLERRAAGRPEVRAELARDQARERRLAESRRTVKQHVLERLAAPLRGVDRDAQVLDDAFLADVLFERARTQARAVDSSSRRRADRRRARRLRLAPAAYASAGPSSVCAPRARFTPDLFAALRRYISASSRSASSIAGRLQRFANHRLGFGALVLELQQHRQRFGGEVGHRARARRRARLGSARTSRLCPAVSRRCRAPSAARCREGLEKHVIAAVDRARDRRHRCGKRARRRARTDRCDGDQRLEELALDRVGEAVVREAAGVAVEVHDGVDLERYARRRATRESSRRCTAAERSRNRGRPLDDAVSPVRSTSEPVMRANIRSARRSRTLRNASASASASETSCGLGGRRKPSSRVDHRVHLFFAGAARADEGALDVRVAERVDRRRRPARPPGRARRARAPSTARSAGSYRSCRALR